MNNEQIQYIDNLNKQFIKFLLNQTKEEYITINEFLDCLWSFLQSFNFYSEQAEFLNNQLFNIYVPANYKNQFDQIYVGDLIEC